MVLTRAGSAPPSLAAQLAALEQELARTERRLVALQRRYERLAERRNALRRVARLLKAEALDTNKALTWAAVCRLKGWNVRGDAHRAVKRRDPRLHILLHQASLGESCSLDRATYPLE
jgi:hypothetical protein